MLILWYRIIMRRVATAYSFLACLLLLQGCRPSDLILRLEPSDGQASIRFYKRDLFGREYEIRPCVTDVVLEGPAQRRIWQISALHQASSGEVCRELQNLVLLSVPDGFSLEVPFHLRSAPEAAVLSVFSFQGSGEITLDRRHLEQSSGLR